MNITPTVDALFNTVDQLEVNFNEIHPEFGLTKVLLVLRELGKQMKYLEDALSPKELFAMQTLANRACTLQESFSKLTPARDSIEKITILMQNLKI